MEKKVCLTPIASNEFMTKPFELGVLQMILSDPPMSYTSGLHVVPTPGGQSLEFGENGLKMLISLQNMSFLSKKT